MMMMKASCASALLSPIGPCQLHSNTFPYIKPAAAAYVSCKRTTRSEREKEQRTAQTDGRNALTLARRDKSITSNSESANEPRIVSTRQL
uniref:Putative secreted peptide n=1 Tax=Anopheles braziliensis TaxID=58242 RepID=A0A2M3ZNC6_9DIPT